MKLRIKEEYKEILDIEENPGSLLSPPLAQSPSSPITIHCSPLSTNHSQPTKLK
jgi:hypothetical protein